MYGKADIKFRDGSNMQEIHVVTYLGGKLANLASRHVEVLSRIKKALQTCIKLNFLWSRTKCSTQWKLQIHNTIGISQLTYGLSTVQLTESLLNKLDAFQIRGCRFILGVEHAYYSGVSNEEIYKRIIIVLNEGEDLDIEWSEFINSQKYTNIKIFGKK